MLMTTKKATEEVAIEEAAEVAVVDSEVATEVVAVASEETNKEVAEARDSHITKMPSQLYEQLNKIK